MMQIAIPHPRLTEARAGVLALGTVSLIFLPPDAEALDVEAARLVQQEMARVTGRTLPISRAWRPVGEGMIALGSPRALAAALGARIRAGRHLSTWVR